MFTNILVQWKMEEEFHFWPPSIRVLFCIHFKNGVSGNISDIQFVDVFVHFREDGRSTKHGHQTFWMQHRTRNVGIL